MMDSFGRNAPDAPAENPGARGRLGHRIVLPRNPAVPPRSRIRALYNPLTRRLHHGSGTLKFDGMHSMIRLYQHPMSAASRYIRLVLGRIRPVGGVHRGKALGAAYRVPAAEPGRHACRCWSTARAMPICGGIVAGEYLDETLGAMMREKRLMPENPHARAETRRLVEWFLVKFEAEVGRYLVGERVYKLLMRNEEGGGAPDSTLIRAGRTNLKIPPQICRLARLLAQLAGGPAHFACRPCRRGRAFGDGLSRRDRMVGRTRGARMVCPAEVAAIVPAHCWRQGARPAAGRPLYRSGFLIGRVKSSAQAVRAQALAQGFDVCRFTAAALPELAGIRLRGGGGAGLSRHDGVVGGDARPPPRSARHVAAGQVGHCARHELRPRPRSAGSAGSQATAAQSRSMRRIATITT